MVAISTNSFKAGLKLEIDGQPYLIVTNEFVKPGKGQAFNRVRLKHLISGKVVDRTFKSGETAELADVNEMKMRLLYRDTEGVTFMDDVTFEQIAIPFDKLGSTVDWLMEDQLYSIVFYKGAPVTVEPPTFMELEIVETAPGIRGDTSGRVLKPAVTSTGAKIQIPIFVDQGEKVKVDTRTGEYVSRASE